MIYTYIHISYIYTYRNPPTLEAPARGSAKVYIKLMTTSYSFECLDMYYMTTRTFKHFDIN